MALKLITPPAVEPITLVEAKAHLRIEDDDEDDLVAMCISASRQHIEGRNGWLQRALVSQTWDLYLDGFPCKEIFIPLPPLQSVTHIKYDDDDGNEQTYSSASYEVDTASEPGRVLLAPNESWPTIYNGVTPVRVRFVAGYSPTADSPADMTDNIPATIKAGMLLYIGTLYAHRETIIVGQTAVELPWAAEALLRPYRIFS